MYPKCPFPHKRVDIIEIVERLLFMKASTGHTDRRGYTVGDFPVVKRTDEETKFDGTSDDDGYIITIMTVSLSLRRMIG